MLNHEIIHAVLQGLPTSFLAHLGDPWLVFCRRIEFALKNEAPPLSALKFALEKTDPRIVEFIARFIKETQRVTALPDLTRRQKELLIVLRTFGPATCAQLSRTLLQDRSHTHKRLAFLVTSGFVAKFHRWDGVYYLASRFPLDRSAADQLDQFFDRLTRTVNGAKDPQLGTAHPVAANQPAGSQARIENRREKKDGRWQKPCKGRINRETLRHCEEQPLSRFAAKADEAISNQCHCPQIMPDVCNHNSQAAESLIGRICTATSAAVESQATTATNATFATSVMLPPRKSSPYFYRKQHSVPTSRRLYSIKDGAEVVDRLSIDQLPDCPIDGSANGEHV